MTLLPALTAAVAAALLALGPLSQQPPSTTPQQTPSKAPVVSLIGCVERVAPTQPVAGSAQPASQRPAYKLIDVQPGTGTSLVLRPDSQVLLSVSTSLTTPIDFGKLQNQWVEVTGTMSAIPAAVTPRPTPQTTPQPRETAPLPTITTASVKVISTECK